MKPLYSILVLALMVLLAGCSAKTEHKRIAPLPAGVSADNLQDCIVPAAFSSDDFRWMGGNLRLTAYNMDLYDVVDVSQMQVGDTLVYCSEPLVISRLEDLNSGFEINGGLEEGGCCLVGYEGGTYVARLWDDHATYTELGTAELPLADTLLIIDCGVDPSDPADTVRTGQKLYLETLADSRRQFSPLNTTVSIEGGIITEIRRRWIP